MAKRLQFWVLLCLLSALSAYAQGTKKFCFSDDLSASPSLKFFQKEGDAANGESCFEYWYNDGVTDAVTFLNDWLSNNSNGIVSLTSDIEFAGRSGDACVESPLAFKGMPINMGGSQILESGAGGPYTISGPCFVTENDGDRYVGFVTFAAGSSGGIRSVIFSDVYFKATASSANVGVIPQLQNCATAITEFQVNNSEFYGDYAGAAVGYFADHTSAVSGVVVNNVSVTGKVAGGVFGYAMNIKGVKNIRAHSVTVSGIDENDWLDCFLGGVFGRLQLAWESGVSNVKVDGLSAHCRASSGVSYMGGIVGYLTRDNSRASFVGDTVVGASLSGGDVMGGLWGEFIYSGNGTAALGVENALFEGSLEGNCNGKVGGIIGELQGGSSATDDISVERTSVLGDISAKCKNGEAAVDTTQVGGLLGSYKTLDGRAPTSIGLSIVNTYTIGDIVGSGSTGYLVGSSDLPDESYASVKNNYHYGETDASTVLGIGSYTLADWQNPSSANIYKNVRNAVQGLDVDGSLITDVDNKIIEGSTAQLANGVADSDEMKSGALSIAFNNGSDVWNNENNINSGLPYFEGFEPVYSSSVESSSSEAESSSSAVESSSSEEESSSSEEQSSSSEAVEESSSSSSAESSSSAAESSSSDETESSSSEMLASSDSQMTESSNSEDLKSSDSVSPASSSSDGSDIPESEKPDYTIPLEIVHAEVAHTGRAIRVSFKGSDFDSRRRASAYVEITDVKTGVSVIDSLLSDSVESACDRTVEFRLKQMGEFAVNVYLKDAKEHSVYQDKIVVDSEIGGEPNTWYMVSLANVDASSLHWNDDQCLYWWDDYNSGDFWQYRKFEKGDSLIQNRGFWYSSLEGVPLKLLEGDQEAKEVVWNLDSSYTGWNMISNPYGWRIDLFSENQDLFDDAAGSKKVFWRYNSKASDYGETRYLEPYEAAWVKVSHPMEWRASGKPAFVNKDSLNGDDDAIHAKLAKAVSYDNWSLQVVLSDGKSKRDASNLVGVSSRSYEVDEPPAGMGDRVNLSIQENGRSLAKSMRTAAETQEWTLRLDASSERVGYLSVRGLEKVGAFGKHVYVTVDGVTSEMKEGDSLRVSLGKVAKTATIQVTSEKRILVKAALEGLRYSNIGNRLQVSFRATEALEGKSAQVDLVDLNGRIVATKPVSIFGGAATVSMDAPKVGLYIVRVRTQGLQRTAKILVK